MKTAKKMAGFFIVEILIVLVIIGILVTALMPNLTVYMKRAQFIDNLTAADAIKTAVESCIAQTGGTANCNGGVSSIPGNVLSAYGGNVNSLTVAAGIITATSTSTNMGSPYTYTLTPAIQPSGAVSWSPGGTCSAANFC